MHDCEFRFFGQGVRISGCAFSLQRCLFSYNGIGLHVVAYSNGDPTTTLESQHNYFESCARGIWVDDLGSGLLSASSINDVFQGCTDCGIYLSKAWRTFTLINPHFEANKLAVYSYASNMDVVGGHLNVPSAGKAIEVHEDQGYPTHRRYPQGGPGLFD